MPRALNHVVTVYRRQSGAAGPYREQTGGWTRVAAGVEGDIQPRASDVEQRPYGRTGTARRTGFFPAGTDIRRDDGLLVTAGPGPKRFIVADAHDWGPPGELECDLEETAEEFE